MGFCFDEVDKKKTVVSIYKTRNRQIKKKKKKRKKISSLGKLEANSSVWIVYKVGQDG